VVHGSGQTGANGQTGPTGAPGPTGGYGGLALNDFQASGSEKVMTPVAHGQRALVIPKGRLVHASAYLNVQVSNHDALTKATNQATAIVTHLGGYAQNVRYAASNNGSGSAYLDLRVPLGKTETAITSLSGLGKLLSQQVSTQDLEKQFTAQTNEIGKLRREIAVYVNALNSGTLTGQQRVAVELKLSNARHQLMGTKKARAHTVASGSTASIQMSLSTRRHGAAVVRPHKRGHLGNLLHNAIGFLALEAIIVLYALLVALPLILLGALVWWFTRGRKQRDEKRLLAST
jgi:hypothetical protein